MSITKTIERIRQDEKGWKTTDGSVLFTHIITIEGVDYPFYSKSADTTPFEAGKEATYTLESAKNPGTFKIKPVKEAKPFKSGGFTKGGGSGFASKNDAVITYLSVLSSVMTGFQQSSEVFSIELVDKTVEYFYNKAKSKAKESGDFKV